jgi:Flp pilus assembly pilin Flp
MLQYLLTWARTLKREEGQDLAEYALLIALISVALVAILVLLRTGIGAVFQTVTSVLGNAL